MLKDISKPEEALAIKIMDPDYLFISGSILRYYRNKR